MASSAGTVRLSRRPSASGARTMHFGSDSPLDGDGVGDTAGYELDVPRDVEMGVLEVKYADEIAGNRVDVFWDGEKRGRFYTDATPGWNTFALAANKVFLGPLTAGVHQLRLEVIEGGSYGLEIDQLRIIEVSASERIPRAYAYVRSLVNPDTGLVASTLYDADYTSVYKNALAAMAFTHENEFALAEAIFDFFAARVDAANFQGLNKNWNYRTGDELDVDRWEGDNAFLLLALNYYATVAGGHGRFQPLADALVAWLISRAGADIVAEGVANMYAALKPFEATAAGVPEALATLRAAFTARADYTTVTDHIVRGALVFSDAAGFAMVESLARTEIAEANGLEVRGVAAFAGDDFVNVEISAQLRLAAHLWGQELPFLDAALDNLWLGTGTAPDVVTEGLPYTVTTHGWARSADAAIIDPTCFMLFRAWSFNPWAPGKSGL
jgi:hypothetical protein